MRSSCPSSGRAGVAVRLIWIHTPTSRGEGSDLPSNLFSQPPSQASSPPLFLPLPWSSPFGSIFSDPASSLSQSRSHPHSVVFGRTAPITPAPLGQSQSQIHPFSTLYCPLPILCLLTTRYPSPSPVLPFPVPTIFANPQHPMWLIRELSSYLAWVMEDNAGCLCFTGR